MHIFSKQDSEYKGFDGFKISTAITTFIPREHKERRSYLPILMTVSTLKNELPLGARKGVKQVLSCIHCTGQMGITNHLVIHIQSGIFFPPKGKTHH